MTGPAFFDLTFDDVDATLLRLDRERMRAPSLAHGGAPAVFAEFGADDGEAEAPAAEPEVEPPAETPRLIPEEEHQSLLNAARETARADAEARLTKAFEKALEVRVAAALEDLSHRLGDIGSNLQTAAEADRGEAIAIGLHISHALVPKALACAPTADVEAMLQELLPHLQTEPTLRLALAPEFVGPVREHLEDVITRSGYRGAFVIEDDPSLAPGDARLEWTEGRALRSLSWLENELVRRLGGNGWEMSAETMGDPGNRASPATHPREGECPS